MKKIKAWICKVFAHSYDLTDLAMFDIQCNAINRGELDISIKCRRCGKVVTPKS
jgi:hypothetical protein